MIKPHIRDTRLADENHAVHTVEGGRELYRREPCETCPWRKDAVGEFPAEAFRLAACTGTDAANALAMTDLDGALRSFACHSSGTRKPAICAGYVLHGDASLGWRIAYSRKRFDPEECSSDVELFDSYYEMAVANGVPQDDPAIALCRPPKSGVRRGRKAARSDRNPQAKVPCS